MTDPLAPLRERYAHWLSLDPSQVSGDREEAAQDIRAMQLVLRMERADPPSWHRALAAAATGAAALCADPRSEPGGEWYDAIRDYCRGHIRKVTRRARGAHWVAAQDLPGITIEIDGTQVRALLPGLVSELDPRISRLQVGGTDVAPDEPPVVSPDEAGAALQVWLAPAPVMTLGQGHGAGRPCRDDRRRAAGRRRTPTCWASGPQPAGRRLPGGRRPRSGPG